MLNQKLMGASTPATYIEDVFSTYLYTGNGTSQTIVNGIDLSTKGGLVWTKARSTGNTYSHKLFDTVRGANKWLSSADTDAQNSAATNFLTAFNTDGFSVSSTGNGTDSTNASGVTEVGWAFAEQPNFFDVVTYTGDGGTNRAVAHSLGSVPGCIMVKATSTANNWSVYHRGLTANQYSLVLNSTAAENYTNEFPTAPDSTSFYVRSGNNSNGVTYVAYLFAHNAGGFGLTGTDNVISCGSFTTATSTLSVTLGYEPQWLLFKRTDAAGDWQLYDNMRGMVSGGSQRLYPNLSNAEDTGAGIQLTATGFNVNTTYNASFIYIAIRRGPMKVPTDATKVYGAVARTGTGATASITSVNFPPDFVISDNRDSGNSPYFWDRLRGAPAYLNSTGTGSEDSSQVNSLTAFLMNGISVGSDGSALINGTSIRYINWFFQRAPNFFDEVCVTGASNSNRRNTHNLGVTPELIILKDRSQGGADWAVWASSFGSVNNWMRLNTTNAQLTSSGFWGSTLPTSTDFGVNENAVLVSGTDTYVAYLFASCPGVSKVGSYTGTGTTKQVDCGFASGARFVLIKRTDSTGDWYVWDTARGIVSGNDPYLLLNSTAAEVTSTDYIDTYSAGFELSSTAPAALNASGGTYIFLAIA